MSIIFHVDLDGTLLTTDKRVGDRTREAISYFIDQGNYFVVNTGRAISSARMIFDTINVGPKNCYISCYNGTCIYDCERDEIIYQCYVSRDRALDLYRLAAEDGIYLITYEGDDVICEKETAASDTYHRNSRMNIVAVGDMQRHLDHDVPKVLSVELENPERARKFADKVIRLYGDELSVLPSSAILYEMFNKDGGKDKAIVKLCELLDIPVANTVAAGDAQNDMAMLKAAGYSIAVQNAVDEVKKVVDEVTPLDNDHDALAEYFMRFNYDRT